MIFVTSGSMLPFDRLFKIIDEAIESGTITDKVFGQIGEGSYEPKNFEFKRFLDKETFDDCISSARLVIGHAGIGVIIQALNSKVPLLVLARRADLGEHVNNHQIATANKFEELGHILSFEENNLKEKLTLVDDFIPTQRIPNIDAVGRRVAAFLSDSLTL
jgi:UDP-N-acetylglucosamine transferase subunit ALG13